MLNTVSAVAELKRGKAVKTTLCGFELNQHDNNNNNNNLPQSNVNSNNNNNNNLPQFLLHIVVHSLYLFSLYDLLLSVITIYYVHYIIICPCIAIYYHITIYYYIILLLYVLILCIFCLKRADI